MRRFGWDLGPPRFANRSTPVRRRGRAAGAHRRGQPARHRAVPVRGRAPRAAQRGAFGCEGRGWRHSAHGQAADRDPGRRAVRPGGGARAAGGVPGLVVDDRYEAFFDWKHEQNPFGRSPAWVAVDGGEVVGFRTFLRWEHRHRRAGAAGGAGGRHRHPTEPPGPWDLPAADAAGPRRPAGAGRGVRLQHAQRPEPPRLPEDGLDAGRPPRRHACGSDRWPRWRAWPVPGSRPTCGPSPHAAAARHPRCWPIPAWPTCWRRRRPRRVWPRTARPTTCAGVTASRPSDTGRSRWALTCARGWRSSGSAGGAQPWSAHCATSWPRRESACPANAVRTVARECGADYVIRIGGPVVDRSGFVRASRPGTGADLVCPGGRPAGGRPTTGR